MSKRIYSKPGRACGARLGKSNRLLVYDKASRGTPPSEFGNLGEDTRDRGIYEVYKKDGTKITVRRRYSDIERLDERLIPFCNETPNW